MKADELEQAIRNNIYAHRNAPTNKGRQDGGGNSCFLSYSPSYSLSYSLNYSLNCSLNCSLSYSLSCESVKK